MADCERTGVELPLGSGALDGGGSQYSIGLPPTEVCSSPTGVSPPSFSNKLLPVYQQTAENAAG